MPAQTARAPTLQPPILLQENVGSIRLLTLNRPAARNSLSEGLIAELHGALKQIHDDNSVRAVVIAANGPAFSAGHDMKELTARRSRLLRRRSCEGITTKTPAVAFLKLNERVRPRALTA